MNNELVPEPSWWKRNWKWVVPLGGCMTLIVIFILFVGTLFFGVTSMMEDSVPYEYALEKINNDDEIVNQLGAPIEKDGMVQGNFEWKNGVKSAVMKVPVSGPKGSGMLYINATGEEDDWTYHEIRIEINDSQSVDLLEE